MERRMTVSPGVVRSETIRWGGLKKGLVLFAAAILGMMWPIQISTLCENVRGWVTLLLFSVCSVCNTLYIKGFILNIWNLWSMVWCLIKFTDVSWRCMFRCMFHMEIPYHAVSGNYVNEGSMLMWKRPITTNNLVKKKILPVLKIISYHNTIHSKTINCIINSDWPKYYYLLSTVDVIG